jgi:hypothetical protein
VQPGLYVGRLHALPEIRVISCGHQTSARLVQELQRGRQGRPTPIRPGILSLALFLAEPIEGGGFVVHDSEKMPAKGGFDSKDAERAAFEVCLEISAHFRCGREGVGAVSL